MTAIARTVVLDLRTAVAYRSQALLLFVVVALIEFKNPILLVPALALLAIPAIAAFPLQAADKAGLETLYAVLPVPRRSVLYGHYAWALATYLALAAAGAMFTLAFARAQADAFDGRTLLVVLTLSWAVFVVNVAIQFPLFIRFGHSRIGGLGTVLPVALIMAVIIKLHLTTRLHVTVASVQAWLPLVWVAGAVAIVASVAVAIAADTRRVR
ncbi:hypothetical protein GCM10023322_35720 [Rugosimonospora acidiphila]|uniref:ABC-2 family transporter protein n=1 Tax=Rugosimonospora acidiphila TaxID=556531 RepID=A0ABP9RW72_9ACTN